MLTEKNHLQFLCIKSVIQFNPLNVLARRKYFIKIINLLKIFDDEF